MSRNLILIFVFAAVFILALIFVTLPLYNRVQDTRASLKAVQNEVANKQTLISVLEELERQFGQLEPQVEKISVAIPKEQQLPELLVMTPLLVSQNGLQISRIDFGQPVKEGSHQVVNINLSVSGSYINVQRFLQALEQNLRLIDVVSLRLNPGDKDNYGLDLVLKTYFQ